MNITLEREGNTRSLKILGIKFSESQEKILGLAVDFASMTHECMYINQGQTMARDERHSECLFLKKEYKIWTG